MQSAPSALVPAVIRLLLAGVCVSVCLSVCVWLSAPMRMGMTPGPDAEIVAPTMSS